MGTPDFATASLRRMVNLGYHIVGVVTAPDKPSGRGQKLNMSSVKKYALDNNLTVFQPKNLKNSTFIENLKSLNADIQVVVAFRKLPQIIWDMPPKGTFNLHASLLPKYRGAAPINWAIIKDEKESGVTTFFIEEDIDTGTIILQKRIPIEPNDNAGDLHDKLMVLGSHLVCETIDLIATNTHTSKEQKGQATFAPKIFKTDCQINWSDDLKTIHQKIKGLSPYPTAWTHITHEKTLKIFESSIEKTNHNEAFGTVLTDGKNELKIAVNNGFIHLLEVQLSGKKRMKTTDFLHGFSFEEKTILF